MKGNVYEAVINSEEGQRIAALGERAECWIDFHKGLDEETGESTETYALSYVKAMTNSGGKISGYIIIDVKRSFIEEILAKAKTCLGSQEVFVLSNGTQIEANAGKVTLAEQAFYQKALEKDDIQSFSYEKVAGKELLFSYQKFGRDMVVCSLIPKDSATANETEAASSELGNGSSQLLETASQLNEAVQLLRENAIDLDSSVKIFKV